jgi:hypothetical protein
LARSHAHAHASHEEMPAAVPPFRTTASKPPKSFDLKCVISLSASLGVALVWRDPWRDPSIGGLLRQPIPPHPPSGQFPPASSRRPTPPASLTSSSSDDSANIFSFSFSLSSLIYYMLVGSPRIHSKWADLLVFNFFEIFLRRNANTSRAHRMCETTHVSPAPACAHHLVGDHPNAHASSDRATELMPVIRYGSQHLRISVADRVSYATTQYFSEV